MISFKLIELVKITNGILVGNNIKISNISTDSRCCVFNTLFVVLKGKNFDAYNFIQEAINKGAIALLVNKFFRYSNIPQIIVQDTKLALGQLSQLIRKKSTATVLAITGSSGKTTVKEMTANILKFIGTTLCTTGNLNNNIGVPSTLIALQKKHQYLVLEMGANAPGEINYLTNLAQPKSALINNISASHLLGFSSIQGVANAKGEIFNGLLASGTAIINHDSNDLLNWQKKLKNKKILYYSVNCNYRSHIWASNIKIGVKNIFFELNTFFSKKTNIKIPLLGIHNVANALAAVTLSISAAEDISLEVIQQGLRDIYPIPGRLFPIQINDKQLIIDDTYNANYGSVIAALNVLKNMPGYLVMVIGSISELGNQSMYFYNKIGKLANIMKIDKIISFGDSNNIISNFSKLGEHFYKKKYLLKRLLTLLYQKKEITILIKGSRIAHMDSIVNILKEKTGVNTD